MKPQISTTKKPRPTSKKSLLENLRDKHASAGVEQVKECIDLDDDCLKEAWQAFTDRLKAQQKHSQSTVFSIAKLSIVNKEHFLVQVSTSIEKKFIEQEKMNLLEFLQTRFYNKNIGFTIEVVEVFEEIIPSEATLTTREKYLRIVDNYPLVKELKDRLKLELDY